jgi:hypothetical protein
MVQSKIYVGGSVSRGEDGVELCGPSLSETRATVDLADLQDDHSLLGVPLGPKDF